MILTTKLIEEVEESRSTGVASALDPRFYLGRNVLDRELEAIFACNWQYAGHVADLRETRTYLTASAGDQPVLLLRGDDGEIRAFRNVCRHRGSQLLTGSGRCKKAIRCRYHGWTYDATDGRLLGVPEHRGYAELDKARLGLVDARVESLAGLLFVNLDPGAPSLAESTGGLGVPEAELSSVYYFVLFPNALVSLHPDYVMLHTLWPREPGRTEVTCEWFFEPQTISRPDFDPSDAVAFWDQVNREDWHVCELAQKGVRSRGYTAGRYTTHEGDVHAFDSMVAERYLEALRAPSLALEEEREA